MSERWKYQIRTGLPWGIFMTIFLGVFGMNDKSFSEQIQSGFFYFQMVIFLLFGVFILGYFSWKSKIKRETRK